MLETRSDARANRARVLEAAKAVFAQKGIGAEVKEIAEQAGVGVGTIYRHFPSKADLVTALALEALSSFVAAVDQATSVQDPIDALRAVLTRVFDSIEDHGWLVEAMLSGEFAPERAAQFRAVHDEHRIHSRLQALVQRGVDQRAFRPDLDVGVATAMILGIMAPWNYRGLRGDKTPEQVANAVIQLFSTGACESRTPFSAGPSK